MNAHTRRFDPVPPWAVASLRAGISLLDGERIRRQLCSEGIARRYREMREIAFLRPDVSSANFQTFRKTLAACGVTLVPPDSVACGMGSRYAGAFVIGQYHPGFHMRAARMLLGWSSGDVSGLPDWGLSCEELGDMETSSRSFLGAPVSEASTERGLYGAEIVRRLRPVYGAAGVTIIFDDGRGPDAVTFGVWAPVEILEPAAGRAALLRLGRGRA
ncbi:hypothetical protein [Maricaulis sp.]|uniref:hypothetical protein n=1 Tax=Maricaulis sp. TaxID=1486257 RepID=UPI003A8D3BF3